MIFPFCNKKISTRSHLLGHANLSCRKGATREKKNDELKVVWDRIYEWNEWILKSNRRSCKSLINNIKYAYDQWWCKRERSKRLHTEWREQKKEILFIAASLLLFMNEATKCDVDQIFFWAVINYVGLWGDFREVFRSGTNGNWAKSLKLI